MRGVIYIIENKINSKVYIGQTIQPLIDRWYRHCGKSGLSESESRMHIKRAILKHGKDNFTIRPLEECDSKMLNEREIFYIQQYDSFSKGYNSTEGGSLGPICKLKINDSEYESICELYLSEFSLRCIAKEYNVDKQTIKDVLTRCNISLRTVRRYKYPTSLLLEIKTLLDGGVSGKYISEKYNMSKSYVSQIKNGSRRI